MKILVTGGCGYVGSVLIPRLLKKNYKIINIDTQWFGNYLKNHRNLKNIKMNISEIEKLKEKNIKAVIHLASIANDPMAELDKNLSWETSALNTFKLMNFMKKNKIRKIIYASSGSVYGIKKEKKVTEQSSLEPISLYNKVKMITERIILSYKDINPYIIRPATVCGYSKRMRLDVTVNALTFSALSKGIINVFGGKQVRPNIHIDDMVNLYLFFLNSKKKDCGIYNAGFENKSILEIAKKIKELIPCKINVIKDKNDPRSYRLNSDKLKKIGFHPSKTIKNAILEIQDMYYKGELKNKNNYHSLKWLKKKLKIKL